MLSALRNSLQGLAARGLLLLLALTFVLWGVSDMLSSDSKENYVLKVGEYEYTPQMWNAIVDRQLEHMKATSGSSLSRNDLKKHGYYNNFLELLTNQAVLIQEAKRLGILVSDDMVRYQIAADPAFRDGTGKFSKDLFENTLKQRGWSEQQFIAMLKENISATDLSSVFLSFIAAPPQLTEQINFLINSPRQIELYELDKSKVKVQQKPTEEELQAILKKEEDRFSIPEVRKVTYFTFGTKDVDQTVEVLDADLESEYKSKLFLFTEPEKRMVHHLIFKDMDKALEAKSQVEAGKTLEVVGKELGALNKDTLIGNMTSRGFDKAIVDAVFSIKAGDVSIPVETPMGIHIFQVTDISPQKVLPFEKAKPILKRQFIENKLFERLSTVAQAIDDEVANNRSIEEIAKEHGYKLSSSNVMYSKKEAEAPNTEGVENSPPFRAASFSTDLNATSMVTPYNNETFFVLRVDEIQPKKMKPEQEVKNSLLKLWEDEQKDAILNNSAAALSRALQENQPIPSEVSRYMDMRELKISALAPAPIPSEFIGKIYKLQIGSLTAPFKADGKYLIAKLIGLGQPNKDTMKEMLQEVQVVGGRDLGDALMHEYLAEARKRYKIVVNYDLLHEGVEAESEATH